MKRRKLLNAIWHLNERTDRIAAIATTGYIAWVVVQRLLPVPVILTERLHYLLVAIEAMVVVLLVAYWIVRLAFVNPNRRWMLVLTDEECGLLRQWLSSGKDSPLLDQSLCKVRFANSSDLDELANLNFEAFLGSAYEASVNEFRSRNAAFIDKNDKCFLLFVDPIGGKELIGYSCLVPLNELGTQLYLEGSVSDATLRKELISSNDETPKSILVFAIHLRQEFSFAKSGASKKYSLYFWSCVRYHFRSLCGGGTRFWCWN